MTRKCKEIILNFKEKNHQIHASRRVKSLAETQRNAKVFIIATKILGYQRFFTIMNPPRHSKFLILIIPIVFFL